MHPVVSAGPDLSSRLSRPWPALLLGTAAALAAGLLRLLLQRAFPELPPFLLFFPALALASLAAGWQAGAAAAVTSFAFVAATALLDGALVHHPGSRLVTLVLFGLSAAATIAGIQRLRDRAGAYRRAVDALRRTEQELAASEARAREQAQELGALLDAVPSAICIARDPDCMRISGNRAAAEMLRVPQDSNMSVSAPAARPALQHFEVFDAAGTPLRPEAMPVQRAARGATIRDFAERLRFDDGSELHLVVNAVPLPGPDGAPRGAVAVLTDVSAMKRVEEALRERDARREMMLHELNHRARNMLSVVQGVAHQTLAEAVPPDQLAAFDSRLRALGQAHGMLAEDSWHSTGVGAIVETALAAHAPGPGRASAEGPEVKLNARTTMALTLGLHELATNALKHGAWKGEEGRVDVRWRVLEGDEPELELDWTESGGPAVKPPLRRGFGTRLIERGLAHDLGGEVRLSFDRQGFSCRIRASLPARGHPMLGAADTEVAA